MSKLNVFSRNNWLELNGQTEYNFDRLDQYVLRTSNVQFNKLNTANDVSVGGNLSVVGNFLVQGQTTIINTNIVDISDNIILINSSNTNSGVTQGGGFSGIEVDRGTLTNYQFVYNENKLAFEIGQIGNLQEVATREDSPLPYGILTYNPNSFRLDSVTTITLPITFSAGNNSTSSSNGTTIINGGLGISKDICIDGKIHFLGTDYTNNISADVNNNLVVTMGENLLLNVPTGKTINIPINIPLNFASSNNNIKSDNTNLALSSSSGSILLNTFNSVVLPTNTFLQWTNGNNVVFDGINMNINATNKINLNAIIAFSNTIPSTSSTVGSTVFAGGISISNTTDATSSSSGGGETIGGGLAVKKSVYIANTLNIGDISIIKIQSSGQGINLRSFNRSITTSGNNDTMFNTFEGGNINTSSSIINSHTLYISSPPTITGGGTLANTYSLTVASGNVLLAGKIITSDTTISTSPSIGSYLISGSIAINNIANSTSVTSGGNITGAGGASFAKDFYIGGKMDVGSNPSTFVQTATQGITLRSRNKIFTTSSTSDITFNSFEGGSIVSSNNLINTSTVFITGSPIISGGGVISNNFALYVGSGTTKFGGNIICSDTSTNSLNLNGGININLTTDSTSYSVGGSFTTLGGGTVGKSLYIGKGIFTNNTSTSAHHTFQNNGLSRFEIDINGSESGGNVGSDFFINRYNDAGSIVDSCLTITRSNAVVNFSSTIPSSSSTVAAIVAQGGISINNTSNALSINYGGSLTSSGGGSFGKDFYIGGNGFVSGNLTVSTTTNLNQTNINTNNGILNITGTNGINAVIGSSSNINTTSGSLTLSSNISTLYLTGYAAIIGSSNGSISLNSNSPSNLSTTSGILTLSGIGILLQGGSGNIAISNTGNTSITCGTGGLLLNTTDTTTGITIGTTNALPITIGNNSTISLNGDLTVSGNFVVKGTNTTLDSTVITTKDIAIVVNNLPNGISDGGLLIHRWQIPNNVMRGDLVTDVPYTTGTFQSGSSIPSTLILVSSASSVDDLYKGWWIAITSGVGANQVRRIKSYVGLTKVATLYITSDNNTAIEFKDGLDLTTAPVSGDTYSLFDKPYIGFYYSATNKEIRVAGVPFDISSGTFGTPTTYLNFHCDNLIIESGLTSKGTTAISGQLFVTDTETNAFFVQKVANGGHVFTVDSTNGQILVANPNNTIGSNTNILFNQFDSVSNVGTYSSITSSILSNNPGSLNGSLSLNVQNGSGSIVPMFTVSGTGYSDFSTNINSVRILNTTSSSLLLSGGLISNYTTNATSPSVGGSTLFGGLGVVKDVYFGNTLNLIATNIIRNSNTISGIQGNLNTNGDICLYGSTQSIYFANTGFGIPSFTTRSTGTKIVLNPNISSSSVDSALGITGTSLWYSVPNSSYSHQFYNGTTLISSINSTGLTIDQDNIGFNLYNGTNTSYIYQLNNTTYFSPHNSNPSNGFVFQNSTKTSNKIGINSDGQLFIGISNYSGTSSTTGNYLAINGNTFTDNSTIASGLVSNMTYNSFGQGTLAASNTSVTTNTASNIYIQGAPTQGTNQIITNSYSLMIDNVKSVTATTGASLYITGETTGAINSYSLLINSGKSLFNGVILAYSTNTVSNTNNTIIGVSGAINSLGDLTIVNSKIYFSSSGAGIPTLTTRSSGTKIVLNPSISSTKTDSAIGITSTSIWYGVKDSTFTHQFYLGISNVFQVDSIGLLLNTIGSTNNIIRMVDNTKGLTINGGNTLGASINLYGNSNTITGDLYLNTGDSGKIQFSTGMSNALSLSNIGLVSINNTTDLTALSVLGGVTINKTLSIGINLTLNFNQSYNFSGSSNGQLNLQSQVSGIAFRERMFTYDANNTTDCVIELYGTGNVSSVTNSELFRIGFEQSTLSYNIKTRSTGTGITRELHLETGNNIQQIQLLTDGTVSMSSTIASSSSTVAAFKLAGGMSISNSINSSSVTNGGSLSIAGGAAIVKDVYIGGNVYITGNLSSSIENPTITIGNITNIAGSVTVLNAKVLKNGNEREFSAIFRMTPTLGNTSTSIQFNIADMISNFVNIYDLTISANGYHNDSSPINLENISGFAVIGSMNAQLQFTSGMTTDINTIMTIIRYTVY